LAVDGVWVCKATSWPLNPLERDRVPIVQEAGWASGPVCIRAEYLAPPPHWDSIPGPPISHGGVEEYSTVVGYDAMSIGK
jgi:hypothetical protein